MLIIAPHQAASKLGLYKQRDESFLHIKSRVFPLNTEKSHMTGVIWSKEPRDDLGCSIIGPWVQVQPICSPSTRGLGGPLFTGLVGRHLEQPRRQEVPLLLQQTSDKRSLREGRVPSGRLFQNQDFTRSLTRPTWTVSLYRPVSCRSTPPSSGWMRD